MQVLRKIAFPFSLLYGFAVYLRNLCYDIGVLNSVSPETPTICVGNLSVGGTGKTPMIEWIIKNLPKENKLAVLSRGYRRKSRGFLIVHPDSDPENTGDEPLQISRKFTNVTVAVEADRREGIRQLDKVVSPDLILLDDAFQHRRIKARFNILLTSYSRLYADDWYLPTGNLRDHKRQARRARVIVVTKCPAELDNQEQVRILKKLRPLPSQSVLFSSLAYGDQAIGIKGSISLSEMGKEEVVLVTAIADPAPLLAYLSLSGIRVRHMNFPDHHFFTEEEISRFNEVGRILTTEKDFTRLNGRVPQAYYLPVEHKFLNGGKEQLISLLKDL
ncbi:tetraacyldisaccharide 4'-kinase [Muriicola marianensis]|uniref:Tetraacyldisaccharide 4'-kinase n=1 Tax=Muriicola marianensis TaxID=1324801 RepID=A0ABQ1QSX5_9FLAO|nr:tetraacyldisaccharide 4'-kinase [Muriicola marianensis]GGD44534.1 tetraacyldisaccharide 4'-kinase [Muriicola marianensis]